MSSKRRFGPRIPFATDTTYPASPASAWASTPVKVDPGAGVKATGVAPSTLLPAQWVNDLLNELSTQAAYIDGIEVQNWNQLGPPAATFGGSALATQINDVCISIAKGQVYTAGEMLLRNEMVRGWNWSNLTGAAGGSPSGGGWRSIDAALYTAGAIRIVACGGGPKIDHYDEVANTWTSITSFASVSSLRVCRADTTNLRVIVGGHDNGGTPRPRILVFTTPTTFTEVVPSNAASYTAIIHDMNVSVPSWYLALSTEMLWHSTDLGATWTRQSSAPFVAESPQALSYDSLTNVHYVITDTGKVYAATAGSTTWVLRGTVSANLTVAPRSLTVKGGILCVVATHTLLGQRLWFSVDGGATWSNVPGFVPLGGNPIVRRIYGGSQLFVAANVSTPLAHMATSLRLA